MFKCRVCSVVPFAALFGFADSPKNEESYDVNSMDENVSTLESDDENLLEEPADESLVPMRTAEEIEFLIVQWDAYISPRSKKLWSNKAQRYAILRAIAQGVGKHDDPFLSSSSNCMRWRGEFLENYPIIKINRVGNKNGEPEAAFVNRLFVFLCGDEECFKLVDPSNCKYFRMACGNTWCVNVTHISLV
ncbi:hypothetical protein BdWA1_003009 [Babesia duncani]|uniref:Uncharacterized protein n=1 Tax=Babesia duncani TaxID=323732 RepID=A0AAD9PIH7_9APIC|nr:hypothetical protein BdWA1_003009 [Babesia duncani]